MAAEWGPGTQIESILAATSLSQIRTQAMAAARPGPPADPWTKVNERRDVLFVAVSTYNECNRPTKDKIAFGNNTLYFVHWIGNSGGVVCTAEVAEPHYRLFVVPLAPLPKTGSLSVQLVDQVQKSGPAVADTTTVDLG
jgi:hypothetical protein